MLAMNEEQAYFISATLRDVNLLTVAIMALVSTLYRDPRVYFAAEQPMAVRWLRQGRQMWLLPPAGGSETGALRFPGYAKPDCQPCEVGEQIDHFPMRARCADPGGGGIPWRSARVRFLKVRHDDVAFGITRLHHSV